MDRVYLQAPAIGSPCCLFSIDGLISVALHVCPSPSVTALRLDDYGLQVPGASLPATKGHPPSLFQPHGRNPRLCERHTQHPEPG